MHHTLCKIHQCDINIIHCNKYNLHQYVGTFKKVFQSVQWKDCELHQ